MYRIIFLLLFINITFAGNSEVPNGFILANSLKGRQSEIREFVPENETISTWTQKISLTQHGDNDTKITSALTNMAQIMRKNCDNSILEIRLDKPNDPDSFGLIAYSCPYSHVSKKTEVALIRIYRDSSSILKTIQWVKNYKPGNIIDVNLFNEYNWLYEVVPAQK